MNKRLHILHLEDSPKDAEMIRAILDAEGIAGDFVRVDTREGFITALEGGGFDLILADYTLPSFDGFSALKITLEKSPEVPFIFVSGTMGDGVAIEAVKNGATDYVLKQNLQRLSACAQRAMREVEERAQRKHVKSELQARYRELEILHEVSQDILGSADLKTLLDRILRRIASSVRRGRCQRGASATGIHVGASMP